MVEGKNGNYDALPAATTEKEFLIFFRDLSQPQKLDADSCLFSNPL